MDPITNSINSLLVYSQNPTEIRTILNGTAYNYAGDILGPSTGYNIGDVYNPTGNVLGTSTTGGSTGTSTNQYTSPLYDQAISNVNQAIGRLPGTLSSGNLAIDTAYQDAFNQLLGSKNTAQSNYDRSKLDAENQFISAKNTIGANAGNTLNGIQRLLGSRGAGGGSAYSIAAPNAVAQAATLQRNEVGNTNAQNQQAMDLNWGNFLKGYNNELSNIGGQRTRQKADLQRSIDTQHSDLLNKRSQLQAEQASATGGNPVTAGQASLDQSNALLNRASNYTVAPINYNTQAYQAPSLASYGYSPIQQTYQGQTTANDYVSPYLQALLGKKKQG